MAIKDFEDIIAWQKAKALGLLVYKLFKDTKDFSFRNQIQRAAVSISNNIAEGFDHNSDKELRRFLFMAKGSCAEVRSMLLLAREIGFISEDEWRQAYDSSIEVSKLINGFIRSLDQ